MNKILNDYISSLQLDNFNRDLEIQPYAIPLGSKVHIQNNLFGLGDAETFEVLCFHIVNSRWDIINSGKTKNGQNQHGLDIFARNVNEVSRRAIAIECKYCTEFTKDNLNDAVERFLSKAPLEVFERFILIVSGKLKTARNARQKDTPMWYLRLARELLMQHNISLEIWTSDHLWAELSQNPIVARMFFNEHDYEIVSAGYREEEKRRIENKTIKEEIIKSYKKINNFGSGSAVIEKGEKGEFFVNENYFSWSNNLIYLNAFLPSLEGYSAKMSGSFSLSIIASGHENAVFVFNHKDILECFWPGLKTNINNGYRKFILSTSNEKQQIYTLDFRSTRLFVHKEIAISICDAVDRFIPIYLNALKAIEDMWQANSFKFHHGDRDVVHLLSLPTIAWESLIEFSSEYDVNNGDTEWHMFDYSPAYLKPYNKIASKAYDEGYHSVLRLKRSSEFSYYEIDDVDLLWEPPNQSFPFQLNERNYWNCTNVFLWITEQLLPEVRRWKWNKLSWWKKIKLQFQGWTADSYFYDINYSNSYQYNSLEILSSYDVEQVLTRVDELQCLYSMMSINSSGLVFISPDKYKEILAIIIELINLGELDYYGYIVSKLDLLIDSPDGNLHVKVMDAVEEKIICFDKSYASMSEVEHAFRVLGEVLRKQKTDIGVLEKRKLVNTLNSFVHQAQEYQVVQRHG